MCALPNQTCYSLLQPHCLVSRGKNKLTLAIAVEDSLVWDAGGLPHCFHVFSTF